MIVHDKPLNFIKWQPYEVGFYGLSLTILHDFVLSQTCPSYKPKHSKQNDSKQKYDSTLKYTLWNLKETIVLPSISQT